MITYSSLLWGKISAIKVYIKWAYMDAGKGKYGGKEEWTNMHFSAIEKNQVYPVGT